MELVNLLGLLFRYMSSSSKWQKWDEKWPLKPIRYALSVLKTVKNDRVWKISTFEKDEEVFVLNRPAIQFFSMKIEILYFSVTVSFFCVLVKVWTILA